MQRCSCAADSRQSVRICMCSRHRSGLPCAASLTMTGRAPFASAATPRCASSPADAAHVGGAAAAAARFHHRLPMRRCRHLPRRCVSQTPGHPRSPAGAQARCCLHPSRHHAGRTDPAANQHRLAHAHALVHLHGWYPWRRHRRHRRRRHRAAWPFSRRRPLPARAATLPPPAPAGRLWPPPLPPVVAPAALAPAASAALPRSRPSSAASFASICFCSRSMRRCMHRVGDLRASEATAVRMLMLHRYLPTAMHQLR